MNFLNINLLVFDYLIIVITTIIIIFSFWKGFINSVLGLLTWIGSVFVTIYTYEYLSQFINDTLNQIDFLSRFGQFLYILSLIISIPVIFLLCLFLLKKIRTVLSSDLDKKILGLIIDKFFGALYGLIFSYIIFSSVLYLSNNNNVNILLNFNNFLVENSNILEKISSYNSNIINFYDDQNTEKN